MRAIRHRVDRPAGDHAVIPGAGRSHIRECEVGVGLPGDDLSALAPGERDRTGVGTRARDGDVVDPVIVGGAPGACAKLKAASGNAGESGQVRAEGDAVVDERGHAVGGDRHAGVHELILAQIRAGPRTVIRHRGKGHPVGLPLDLNARATGTGFVGAVVKCVHRHAQATARTLFAGIGESRRARQIARPVEAVAIGPAAAAHQTAPMHTQLGHVRAARRVGNVDRAKAAVPEGVREMQHLIGAGAVVADGGIAVKRRARRRA